MPTRRPLVAIAGATGTGKSELAVSLATRFDGEIINADALQLYQGLDIITNKISSDDQRGIPHHLLSIIGLDEPTWTVGQYTTRALNIIEDVHRRGKLPIVVGGTHYYTQSLLLHDSLASSDRSSDNDYLTQEELSTRWPILDSSTDLLLAKLREVDPVMADRWHPHDRRKIQTSLEIWLRTGRAASDIYAEQTVMKQAAFPPEVPGHLGQPKGLRFDTLVLWIHAEREALYQRLDDRIDQMQLSGLFQEIGHMNNYLTSRQMDVDTTSGIWIAIGFKEFQEYLRAIDEDANQTILATYKKEGLERMKARTRQYAKRQVQWIRIKLIHALRRHEASNRLFLLDGTSTASFDEEVLRPAANLVETFLGDGVLPDAKELSSAAAEFLLPKQEHDMRTQRHLWVRNVCEVCNVTAVTPNDWQKHVNSRAHRAAERRMASDVTHDASIVHQRRRRERAELQGDLGTE